MQYGYFDDNAREYVITDPKTPFPGCGIPHRRQESGWGEQGYQAVGGRWRAARGQHDSSAWK